MNFFLEVISYYWAWHQPISAFAEIGGVRVVNKKAEIDAFINYSFLSKFNEFRSDRVARFKHGADG